MRSLARTSLGMLGLALIAPGVARAQDAPTTVPSGYQSYLGPQQQVAPQPSAAPAVAMPAPSDAPIGPDGRPLPATAVEAPHKHKGRTLCAKCAAKMQAANNNMPPGRIVGCEHSKNGVCTACQAALNMPGQFTMAPGQPGSTPAEAPGRAFASSGPTPSPSSYIARPGNAMAYDPAMAEPAPVGVVQANFSQGAPMGTAGAYAPQAPAMAPGRAVAESNPGHDPYQVKSGPFPRPHILGHLFGWSGLGAEKAEAKAWKKAETHAMITYDENGTAPVDELPASTVFGKKGR
jgi:hypothetical protein